MTTHPLALDNIVYLQQALALLESLPDDLYTRTAPPMFTSSLGSHYRHVLDHVECFLAGWEQGEIDYDARRRKTRVETDRAYAAERTRDCIDRLRAVPVEAGERTVTIHMACGEQEEGEAERTHTTVARELQFLISHTVHHYALIAVLLRLEGREPGEDFGVAPSTLRYLRGQASCAR